MNAYLVDEDGEHRVWVAETMVAALDQAWRAYWREMLSELQESDRSNEADERQHWEAQIVRSCHLVGPVGIVAPEDEP